MRLIEPFGAGGGPDIVARALAGAWAVDWGRPVDVVNHPGGGSTAAPALVLEAPADGDTLLINTSAHAYSVVAVADLPYQPLSDFVAVAPLTTQAYVVVAGADSGFSSLAELIAGAKAAPGSLRFGSTGVGTGTHIGTEALNLATGIEAMHAPAGPDDSIADVVSGAVRGTIDYMMAPISIAAESIQAGDLVALGVTTARPAPALPNVPALADAGARGYDFSIWYGAWAHVATPPAIVKRRADDIATALSQPGVREVLAGHGMLPMSLTSDEFVRFVIAETDRATRIISAPGPT
jgi:tripartite-type tricarboxylate transporter receptor subunit TctC